MLVAGVLLFGVGVSALAFFSGEVELDPDIIAELEEEVVAELESLVEAELPSEIEAETI